MPISICYALISPLVSVRAQQDPPWRDSANGGVQGDSRQGQWMGPASPSGGIGEYQETGLGAEQIRSIGPTAGNHTVQGNVAFYALGGSPLRPAHQAAALLGVV